MGIRQHYLKVSRNLKVPRTFASLSLVTVLLYLSMIALVFVLANVVFLLERVEQLEGEKQQLVVRVAESTRVSSPGIETQALRVPKLEDLPMVIDDCTKVFAGEKVGVLSFNLERFGSESMEKSELLNYAVVRMKVQGSWEGMNKGVGIIETWPDQLIKVDEALLEGKQGEFLFRIYYLEPNNPS